MQALVEIVIDKPTRRQPSLGTAIGIPASKQRSTGTALGEPTNKQPCTETDITAVRYCERGIVRCLHP